MLLAVLLGVLRYQAGCMVVEQPGLHLQFS